MRAPARQATPQFSQPVRQVLLMLAVVAAVVAGGYFAYARIYPIFLANPWLNGLILAVFAMGVLACFWQLVQLMQSVVWIEHFAANRTGYPQSRAPLLLAPLAALLGARGPGRALATGSARSILESVATRIDEARDITRYLANLLIFLGLLGTFYGLATTVPAVVDTIRALAPKEGDTAMSVFDKLMGGLEAQLGGMGTAFSSSLLGLAGSLVVGLLELFVTQSQNRFYRELEEWISSITRLGFAGADGEAGEASALAVVVDQMGALAERIEALTARIEADQAGAVLARLADTQQRLAAALEAQTAVAQGLAEDAEGRMRLRSIDLQLMRLLEEVAAGRQESMAELRTDFAGLTRAILSRRGEG